MEVTGKIKKIEETKTFGDKGFRKREMILTTNDQYPQMLKIEFVQDKCDLLNTYEVDKDVKIYVNLLGREWINPKGEVVYFNTIQGWKIETLAESPKQELPPAENYKNDKEDDDLPF